MRRLQYALLISIILLLSPISSILFEFESLEESHYDSFSVVSDDANEASDYTLLYELDIGTIDNYNSNGINYDVDNSDNIDFTFDRVAYHLELQRPGEERIFVYVSFPSLSVSLEDIGVPHIGTGVVFQQLIEDMYVESNHPSLSGMSNIDTGVIEFWPSNYEEINSISVPGASDSLFDFGDKPVNNNAGYGSMQIHDYASEQTLFSYNRWGYDDIGDLGIGNNPDSSGHPDWTFTLSADDYILSTLRVLVREGPAPPGLAVELESPDSHQIVQRQLNNMGTFPINGKIHFECDLIEARLIRIDTNQQPISEPSEWTVIADSYKPSGSSFYGSIIAETGWYEMEIRFSFQGVTAEVENISPIGIGEVFIIAGQSNSANHGDTLLTPQDSRVSSWGPDNWQIGADPQPIATGSGGSPWPALGDNVVQQYDVPVGMISVGWGGTTVAQWLPDASDDLFSRIKLALDEVGPNGARALLWHQGESDLASDTSTEDYTVRLSEIITASRIEAGWELPWVVARASFLPNYEASEMEIIISAQQAVIDSDPLTFEGPFTDDLIGDQWRYDTVHFNEAGLREHADRWHSSIVPIIPNYTVLDDDNDGIENELDLCPETLNESLVDVYGCSEEQSDVDGDGIRNEKDNCPNTPLGDPVYTDGCSDRQLGNEIQTECLAFTNISHDYDYDVKSKSSFNISGIISNYCNDAIMYPSTLIVNNNIGITTSTDSVNWRYVIDGVNSTYNSYEVKWRVTRNISLVPDGTQIFLDLHPTRDNCFENCSTSQEYHYNYSMLFGNLNPQTNNTNVDDLDDNNTITNSTENETSDSIGDNNEEIIEEESNLTQDSDGDGVQDSEDKCRGYDDSIDSDTDGIPDACDSSLSASLESENSNLMWISISVLGLILMILIGSLTIGIIKK
jgi:hypothetical protein